MCLRVHLNGGNSREGIQTVRMPVGDNQLQEGSMGEGSFHSSDNVLDDGGDNYGYCPTFFFSENKLIDNATKPKILIYRRNRVARNQVY